MLVTSDDIRKYRPIAGNLDDIRRLETYINEAEQLDIIPVIGAELYKQITDNPSNYNELLNGGYYNNNTQHFAGLKAAICMLAYARFLPNNIINVTPFGVKEKLSIDSNTVDNKTLFYQINETRKIGLAYLQQVVDYLNINTCKNKKINKNKFKAIG